MHKCVYFFGGGKAEGDGGTKDILGNKGTALAEMGRIAFTADDAVEMAKKGSSCRFSAIFSGDPRDAVLKLKVPSGKTNDWGHEGKNVIELILVLAAVAWLIYASGLAIAAIVGAIVAKTRPRPMRRTRLRPIRPYNPNDPNHRADPNHFDWL